MNRRGQGMELPSALCTRAQTVAEDFAARTGVRLDSAELIGGRATLLGLAAPGRTSAGGATRLLRCADAWCAVTLSRPDDVDSVAALVQHDAPPSDPWAAVCGWAAHQSAVDAVQRAQLLGIPAAVLGEVQCADPRVLPHGPARAPGAPLLVADLSSMWAGPLCGQLLRRVGATVVKVESPARPDGTRRGPAPFFDWMNHGKLSYAIDFDDEEALRSLLTVADVVIEGSRPAALSRRRLGPSDITARGGRVWLRITGYGAEGDSGARVAFGDDAAVAGGLVENTPTGPIFVGDAIADPLTGLHAAAAVVDSLARGGGELIEMSMAAVSAGYAPFVGGARRKPPVPPSVPAASSLGADNAAVRSLVNRRHSVTC
ncbi:CoA transferase [Mycolicibacterium sp. PDY-3]|uniref:CoA transferase n=1 Tax=Mycolicibacterium sp. PDY-3 TaxID=3376069 RepID=UPI0037A02580